VGAFNFASVSPAKLHPMETHSSISAMTDAYAQKAVIIALGPEMASSAAPKKKSPATCGQAFPG
jgi:hypothetical protein